MMDHLSLDSSRLSPFQVIVALALMAAPSVAAAARHHKIAQPIHNTSLAKAGAIGPSYLVMQENTGEVVGGLARQQDLIRRPASQTKLMTVWCALTTLEEDASKPGPEKIFPQGLDTLLPISHNAATKTGSTLGLKTGGSLSLRTALQGGMTISANDAATVIGEAIGGSESGFAAVMNQQAHDLGMFSSKFASPSGQDQLLPNKPITNLTTAEDMAKLFAALNTHFGVKYGEFLHPQSMVYKGRTLANIEKDTLNHNVGQTTEPLEAIMVKGGINIGGHSTAVVLHATKTAMNYILVILGEPNGVRLRDERFNLFAKLDADINGPPLERPRQTPRHHHKRAVS